MYLIIILSDDYHKLFRKMTTLKKKFIGQPHRSLTVERYCKDDARRARW